MYLNDNGGFVDYAEVPAAPAIDDVFSPTGAVGKFFGAGYTPRVGQIAMARAVDHALKEGHILAIEGPCGVGKSFAYGIATVLHTLKAHNVNGHRPQVLIATANITLQEQLVHKDIPDVARILGLPDLTVGLLKGRNNYVCNAAVSLRQSIGWNDGRDSSEVVQELEALEEWLAETDTGDRADAPQQPSSAAWSKVSVGSENCPGKGCSFFADCHAVNANRNALSCDVIVTNYHMLLIDIVKQQRGLPGLFENMLLVCDEAHELTDIAREVLGASITQRGVRVAMDYARKAGLDELPYKELETAMNAVFLRWQTYVKSPDFKVSLKHASVLQANAACTLLTQCRDAASSLASNENRPARERAFARMANLRFTTVYHALTLADRLDPRFVTVPIEIEGRVIGIRLLRLEPGSVLAEYLWADHPEAIITSATLTTQGSFGFLSRSLGLPAEGVKYCVIESPFDYKKRGLIIIPDMPEDPNSEPWRKAMVLRLRETVRSAKGRTLALFTSYRNLKMAADALAGDCPYRVLVQGDMPTGQLIKTFREDQSSVLLGTTSLWTGVDVPGESCIAVFIDKLPFPTPADPILDALSILHDDWFSRFSLPMATIALRQGVGRLLRRDTDYGVVVFTDPRVVKKGYGKQILNSLPPMRVGTRPDTIGAFLEHLGVAPPTKGKA